MRSKPIRVSDKAEHDRYLIYRHLYYNLIGNVQLIVQTVAATYTKT